MTSDNYLPAIQTFTYLFNKYYYGEANSLIDCVISGFSPPNFELSYPYRFVSVGDQSDFPFNKWSDALYITLEQVLERADEIVLIMLEDYWLTRPVQASNIEILVDYMHNHPDVLKIDLCADRLYALGTDMNYDTVGHFDLIKSNPKSAYHMSLWPGLWRVDNLLKVLIPNESPHDIEITGTSRLAQEHPELIVLGTRQNPMQIGLGLRARDSSNLITDFMKREDYLYCLQNGYFSYWGKKIEGTVP